MASRIDYSQNRKLYVGTTAELSVADGETIIDNKLIIGGSTSSLMLDVASDAIIGSINTASSTINYENKLIVAGKNNYSDGTTWFGSYGQILLSSNTNMTGSARQFLITNALDNTKFAIIRSVDASTNPVTNSTASGVNSGTADLVIDNTGKVGIGTTSPDYKFEVQGVISSADSSLQKATFANVGNDLVLTANADATNVTAKMLFKSSGTGGGTVSEKMSIQGDGTVVIGSSTLGGSKTLRLLSADNAVDYDIDFQQNGTTNHGRIRYSEGPSDLLFYPITGVDPNLTLRFAGNSYFSRGNVGIGDTTNNAKLGINGGAVKIKNIVSSSPGSDVRRNINIATFDGQGSTFTGKLIIETPVMTTGAMGKFKISGWQYDESWDLTVSGYLRIGTGRGWQQIGGAILTGNPPFDVDEVRLCYNSTTNIFYIILGDASTFWDYYASIVIDADSYYQDSVPTTGWDMSVATADPSGLTSDITLTDIAEYGSSNAIIPGSVAIGSYSTNGRLNVTDGDAEMIFGSASSARPWLRLKHNVAPADGEEVGLLDFNGFNDADQDTRYAIFTAKAEDVSDGTEDGSLTLMTQKAGTLTNTLTGRSGKVGIANANPAQALDVTGKIRVTDDLIMAQQNGRIDYDNGVATGALRFFSTSGNTERMRLSSSGDVLIGTTSRISTYPDTFTTLSLVSRKDGDDASILELRGARSQNNGNQNSMIQFWNETSTATEVGRISSLQGGDVDDGQIAFMTADGGSLSERMSIGPDGIIKFNNYNATNNTGTPTYMLGTDASGNVVKTNTSNTPVGSNIYTLPSTTGSSAWKLLGRFTANNGGQSIFIKMVTNAGYNASIDQNAEVYIRFKTSNGGSVDANGFSGDSSFYTIGASSGYPGGNIKWKSNAAGTAATSYELYINMPQYSGNGGFYSVENTVGTWTPLNNAATDPGAASSTILLPTKQFKVGGSDLVVGAGGADSYFANSNVGIGVTGPLSPLSIQANSGGGALRLIGRSDGISGIDFFNSTQTVGNYFQSNGTWIRLRADGGFHFSKGSTPITTDVDGFTIEGMNVGIGTASPDGTLHVVGKVNTNRIVSGNLIAGNIRSNLTTTTYLLLVDLNVSAGFSLVGELNAASYTTYNVSRIYIRKNYNATTGAAVITGIAKSGSNLSVVDISHSSGRFIAIKLTGDPEIDVMWTGYRLNDQFNSDGTIKILTSGVTENSVYASY